MRAQSILRAVAPVAAGALLIAGGDAAAAQAPATAAASASASAPAARVVVNSSRLDVLRGRRAYVRGTVRPVRAGRSVRLDRLDGRRWRTLATTTTDSR